LNAHSGWKLQTEAFEILKNIDSKKSPLDFGLAIKSTANPELFFPTHLKNSLKFFSLGFPQSEKSGLVLLNKEAEEEELLPQGEIKLIADSSRATELTHTWDYSERKSPTYGYENAAIFPDSFTLKTNYRNPSEQRWAQSFTTRPPNPNSLRAYLRNPDENPRSFEKYLARDFSRRTAAVMTSGEEMGENAFEAGKIIIDRVARKLLCQNRKILNTSQMRISILTPRKTFQRGWAAIQLATDGILEAAEKFNIRICDIDISPYTSTESYPEFRVWVDSPTLDLALPFDGFRMTEEALFALGPKSLFVEIGSHILRHVRVTSNYVTHLDLERQKEVYDKIVSLFEEGKILTAVPIRNGGIVEALSDLAIKGQAGVQLRPGLSPIELFSSSPGRILVGVSPQDSKLVEKLFPKEYLTPLGSTSGSKILGASLDSISKSRQGRI
jgi:hypothetical protein